MSNNEQNPSPTPENAPIYVEDKDKDNEDNKK